VELAHGCAWRGVATRPASIPSHHSPITLLTQGRGCADGDRMHKKKNFRVRPRTNKVAPYQLISEDTGSVSPACGTPRHTPHRAAAPGGTPVTFKWAKVPRRHWPSAKCQVAGVVGCTTWERCPPQIIDKQQLYAAVNRTRPQAPPYRENAFSKATAFDKSGGPRGMSPITVSASYGHDSMGDRSEAILLVVTRIPEY